MAVAIADYGADSRANGGTATAAFTSSTGDVLVCVCGVTDASGEDLPAGFTQIGQLVTSGSHHQTWSKKTSTGDTAASIDVGGAQDTGFIAVWVLTGTDIDSVGVPNMSDGTNPTSISAPAGSIGLACGSLGGQVPPSNLAETTGDWTQRSDFDETDTNRTSGRTYNEVFASAGTADPQWAASDSWHARSVLVVEPASAAVVAGGGHEVVSLAEIGAGSKRAPGTGHEALTAAEIVAATKQATGLVHELITDADLAAGLRIALGAGHEAISLAAGFGSGRRTLDALLDLRAVNTDAGTVIDVGTGGHDATLGAGAEEPAVVGTYWDLDGGDDLDIAAGFDLDLSAAWSIAIACRRPAAAAGTATLLTNWEAPNADNQAFFNYDTGAAGQQRHRVRANGTTEPAETEAAGLDALDDTDMILVWTHDGVSLVTGYEVLTAAQAASAVDYSAYQTAGTTGSPWRIGGPNESGAGWTGRIYGVKAWAAELTAEQVASLTLADFTEPAGEPTKLAVGTGVDAVTIAELVTALRTATGDGVEQIPLAGLVTGTELVDGVIQGRGLEVIHLAELVAGTKIATGGGLEGVPIVGLGQATKTALGTGVEVVLSADIVDGTKLAVGQAVEAVAVSEIVTAAKSTSGNLLELVVLGELVTGGEPDPHHRAPAHRTTVIPGQVRRTVIPAQVRVTVVSSQIRRTVIPKES